MSLDVWFKEDIQHTLLALNEANGTMLVRLAANANDLSELQTYRDGYCDALRAVAIALGIALPNVLPEPLTLTIPKTRIWKEVTTIVGTQSD